MGEQLTGFLALFADCFGRRAPRRLLRVYVEGQFSNLHRKTAESIALRAKTFAAHVTRCLESIKWDEEKLRDRCQQIVARDHANPEAIGCVDESGIAKSGQQPVGVGRQYNGNRGKVDNCVVGVHLSYSAPGFQVLLDCTDYLPEELRQRSGRPQNCRESMRVTLTPSFLAADFNAAGRQRLRLSDGDERGVRK